MNDLLLPVASQSAISTTIVTTTGIEKIFTFVGIITVGFFVLVGGFVLIVRPVFNWLTKTIFKK